MGNNAEWGNKAEARISLPLGGFFGCNHVSVLLKGQSCILFPYCKAFDFARAHQGLVHLSRRNDAPGYIALFQCLYFTFTYLPQKFVLKNWFTTICGSNSASQIMWVKQ